MAFDRLSNRSDEFCMNLSLKSRDLENDLMVIMMIDHWTRDLIH